MLRSPFMKPWVRPPPGPPPRSEPSRDSALSAGRSVTEGSPFLRSFGAARCCRRLVGSTLTTASNSDLGHIKRDVSLS
ncbi:hypothetical protein CesoFtcFv8_023727 [Champsocephalus esox]|uniref:Uncharacterized protein n=1 Tax=Champsocephalus esox TaxID=159716 RepID=A0AAN8B519_9TELE|nr:hypothetical protein CesoFtcFv8_023727 [Champsocephalus esox]